MQQEIIHTCNDRTPFTYCITHIPSGKRYYGVRYAKNCHPSDILKTYFTSSKKMVKMIKQNPKEFSYEIRKIFSSIEKAQKWEVKVLIRLKVMSNPSWFNNGVCGGAPIISGEKHHNKKPEYRKMASERIKASWTEERKEKHKEYFKTYNPSLRPEARLPRGKNSPVYGKSNYYYLDDPEKTAKLMETNHPDVLSGKAVHIYTGMAVYKNSNGDILYLSNDDERVISGEYFSIALGVKPKRYPCPVCGKEYALLKKHLKLHKRIEKFHEENRLTFRKPWNKSAAVKSDWQKADWFYDKWCEFQCPSSEARFRRLVKNQSKLTGMVKQFNLGWIPMNDEIWCEWKNSF